MIPDQILSTPDEARLRVQKIRGHVEDIKVLIVEAYTRRDWVALDYTSWDAYCTSEFGASIAIPKTDRADLVFHLRDHGMSLRAIESATGISKDTVARELTSGVSNETPDLITGTDGKKYTPKQATAEDSMDEARERVRRIQDSQNRIRDLTADLDSDDPIEAMRKSLGINDEEWQHLVDDARHDETIRLADQAGGEPMLIARVRRVKVVAPDLYEKIRTGEFEVDDAEMEFAKRQTPKPSPKPMYEYRVRSKRTPRSNWSRGKPTTEKGAREYVAQWKSAFHELKIERREVGPWEEVS